MRPYLSVTLEHHGTHVAASALVDTGASLNVLPYSLGLSLGAVWREEAAVLRLGGNLAPYAACPLFLNVAIGTFAPVRFAFAWTQAENVPLLFGQTNFFAEFDVCFFRARKIFEVQPKQQQIMPTKELQIALRNLRIFEQTAAALQKELAGANPDLLAAALPACLSRIKILQAEIAAALLTEPLAA